MNIKSYILRTSLCFMALCASLAGYADTDVSALFLTNWGFDSDFNYEKNASGNVEKEIKQVPGWTQDHNVDYTIVGTYQFGTKKTFNTYGKVPASGYDGSEGCLALSTGWDVSLVYSQAVSLPTGSYYLSAAWYNNSDKTGGKSRVGWIPDGGTSILSNVSSFPMGGKWTLDKVVFNLTKQTTGKVQIGFLAVSGGSANSAKVVLDYVKLYMTNDAQALDLVHTYLAKALAEARSVAGTGECVGLNELNELIEKAQCMYDEGTANFDEQLAMRNILLSATEKYQFANATESTPLNITDRYLVNPSFEDGTKGWVAAGMSRQSNSNFTMKEGSYYMEKWTGIGSRVSDVSLTQTLTNLPVGKYRLTAAALHIQQTGSGSTQNSGAAQTGAYLFAGNYKTSITRMNSYELDFVVNAEDASVDLGVKTGGATGNWVACDNFHLYYLGNVDANALRGYLEAECKVAEEYLNDKLQAPVRTQLASVLAEARKVLADKYASDDTVQAVTATLKAINSEAAESVARFESLNKLLTYARKVSGWWKGVAYRQTAWERLQTAINTAQNQYADESLTNDALTNAVGTLNTAVKAVDKSVYESGSAVGKGDALNNPDNTWCNERSMQSKHWILYWEKGYGSGVPSNVEEVLANCDKYFELYAGKLGFITVDEGKSKTDKYKMIIRLKYKDEWEANGSGIDNQIGMLTLSRWAFSSRGGQTVAHEVGHCFQYQVHCDKGDWNGWMYNWTNSPGGNCFWEQCAQWMAYCYYTNQKFSNEWLNNSLNNMHKHVLDVGMRYENYFIQDYFVDKQKDMAFIGRLWNECKDPEDPLQTYMRLTMTGSSAQKLVQLGDEMWEFGARMASFDFDHLRSAGAGTIGKRNQTKMTQDDELFWTVDPSDAPENFGHNAIRLNVPDTQKHLVVEFEGMAQADGYRSYKPTAAGWRIGFVALTAGGTRIYGDVARATAKENKLTVEFDCPADCKNLWLIVSGAPTAYWCRGWGDNLTHEQWPYKVRIYNTNLLGEPNSLSIEVDVAEARTKLKQLCNAYKLPTANVGDVAFQYPTEGIEALKLSISQYRAIANDDATTLDALNNAILQMAALRLPALNMPDPQARYTLTNVSEGFNSRNKAVTYVNDREDAGGYSIRYLMAPNANYAQAFTFTPVAGKKDCYLLSQTDSDGLVRYLCPGTVYDGNANQIRTTTNRSEAGEYIVNAMNSETGWYLWNVAAKNYVSANSNNADNGVYTSGSYFKMMIAEADMARAELSVEAGWHYSTFMIPFTAEVPEEITAYSIEGIENDVITLKTEKTLTANTPFIVFTESADAYTTILEGWGTATGNTYEANMLTGYLTSTKTKPGVTAYMLQKDNGVTGFYRCQSGTEYTVAANRALLKVTSLHPSFGTMLFSLYDDAAAIEAIEAVLKGATSIYDLNGRRLDRLQKGINIVNGRKILVK